ncbi:transcriptional regulator [Methylorubrum extorquens]|uniref:helix-turn-helix domain-containing protein n=1 Tax=Methylorubrum extorquens TaxID=408 RepID=UPI0011704095|nr:helix-turn-helix domain-containing protein [Methylorubrum extorquens]GEL43975.1 transcriptional regulator [Methylorubrum extorquens]
MDDPSASPKQATKDDVIVGLRIQALRKSKGLSQTALGVAIGVSFQQIQKYENGMNRVGAGRLGDIARVLGVPVSVFFEEGENAAAKEKTEAFDFLRVPGAVDLLNAFITIEDDQLRREVLALVRSAARMEQDLGT